jgi:hypothetical protein
MDIINKVIINTTVWEERNNNKKKQCCNKCPYAGLANVYNVRGHGDT